MTMPVTGYVAMTLGVVFTVIVGSGLVTLMFYSSRHGFDEPPIQAAKPLSRGAT